jgi:hypothetical protein
MPSIPLIGQILKQRPCSHSARVLGQSTGRSQSAQDRNTRTSMHRAEFEPGVPLIQDRASCKSNVFVLICKLFWARETRSGASAVVSIIILSFYHFSFRLHVQQMSQANIWLLCRGYSFRNQMLCCLHSASFICESLSCLVKQINTCMRDLFQAQNQEEEWLFCC